MSIQFNPALANNYLGRLFKDAADGAPAEARGLGAKGLQIADASADPAKKIKLKPAEVDQLLGHVEKLPAAEKAAALRTLDIFRDSFDFGGQEAAQKKLLNFVPKTEIPLHAEGRVRSVQTLKEERAGEPVTASAKDIKGAGNALDELAKAVGTAGAGVVSEAAAAVKNVFDEGKIKASPEDGGRKEYVKTMAKNTAHAFDPMEYYDKMANSPYFEDRIMAFMGAHATRFMKEMNERLASFDDPERHNRIREAFKPSMKDMLKMADRLDPQAKARVAQELHQTIQQNPKFFKDEAAALVEWADAGSKLPPPQAGAGDAKTLESMPPADSKVIEAMKKSDNRQVREWGAVLAASEKADKLRAMAPQLETANEDTLRSMHKEAGAFKEQLELLKPLLPKDIQENVGQLKLDDLPEQIDPTSRQIMFQQINVMMNQYQQIMQAMSEIINKMNEMAMDPIRKMGR
jgi:hypothetical protein